MRIDERMVELGLAESRSQAQRLLMAGSVRVDGAEFVMRASTVEYHAPARFDDLLEIYVRVDRLGRTSVSYELCALRVPDETLMVTATQTLVLVDLATRRPMPVPDATRAPIRGFEGSDLVG